MGRGNVWIIIELHSPAIWLSTNSGAQIAESLPNLARLPRLSLQRLFEREFMHLYCMKRCARTALLRLSGSFQKSCGCIVWRRPYFCFPKQRCKYCCINICAECGFHLQLRLLFLHRVSYKFNSKYTFFLLRRFWSPRLSIRHWWPIWTICDTCPEHRANTSVPIGSRGGSTWGDFWLADCGSFAGRAYSSIRCFRICTKIL